MTIGALTSPVRTSSLKARPGLRPLAVAEPADPRRQALERDARLGHRDPAAQTGVVGEQLEDGPIGPGDVGRVARQRRPAERATALAELRPDERGHEPRVVEGVGDAGLLGLGAQVVAVVEDDRARSLEGEHRPDVVGHRGARPALVLVRLGRAQGRARRRGRSPRARSPPRASCADVWSVTRSNRSPAAAQAGSISAALPTSAIESRLARSPPRPGPRPAPRPDRGSAGRRSRSRAAGARAPRRPRSRGRRPRSSSPRAAGRRPCRRARPSA